MREVRPVLLDSSEPSLQLLASKLRSEVVENGVGAVRNLDLCDGELVSLTAHFGTPSRSMFPSDLVQNPYVHVSSNAAILSGKRQSLQSSRWHVDDSFLATIHTYTFLKPSVLPLQGGSTEFVDLGAAFDSLDSSTQATLRVLVGIHRREGLDPVEHPLVQIDPVSGRECLCLSEVSLVGIKSPLGNVEPQSLIADLLDHATCGLFTSKHQWAELDLAAWSNYRVMHRGRADHRDGLRVMFRCCCS